MIDIAVGATGDDNPQPQDGAVYVLFLNANGTVKSQTKISNGLNGLTAGSLDVGDRFGSAVAGLGDLDGDGVADLVVGALGDGVASGSAGTGAVHVLLLNADGTVKSQTKISDGLNGLTAGSLELSDLFGSAVASLGDLDGDGVVDIAVGALNDENTDSGEGAVYVLFLNANGTVKSQVKISDGLNGLAAGSLRGSDRFGSAVASLGDLDGDGVADIAVGARSGENTDIPGFDFEEGAVYVLFLNSNGTVKNQVKISDGLNGLAPDTLGRFDHFGSAVASLGDLDGDGVVDIAVGAESESRASDNGAVYVLLLNADGTVKSQAKISDGLGLPPGSLDRSDFFGSAVAGLGDLDGDGVVEIAVGAKEDENTDTSEGAVYILSITNTKGVNELPVPVRVINGTNVETGAFDDVVTVTGKSGNANYIVNTGGGNDVVEIDRGDGAVPEATIMGGAGDDTVVIDTTDGLLDANATITYDGGAGGNDVLSVVGSKMLTSVTYQVDNANPQSGVLIHKDESNTQTIDFENLEPVLDTSMSPVLDVQQGDDLATVIDNTVVFDGGPQSGTEAVGFHLTGRVQFDDSEYIEFAQKDELIISTGAGTDSVLLNHPGQVDGLTEITVEGGGGSTDSVTVVEVDSASNIVYTPDDADGGMLTGAQAVPVTVNAVNTLVVDGQNSAIDLQLPQTSGADSVTVEATGSDSGTITRGSTLPLSFANAGAGSSILIDDSAGGSNDLLTFNGSSDADTFRISTDTGSSNGVIDLSGLEVAVETASVESANINTGAEDDLVELTGPLPFTLGLAGGTGNDTLLLNPNGTSITIDVSGANPVVYGGGFGTQSEPLAISQFETITLAAADANVSIVGGNRSLSYTPALSGSGAVFVQELGLTLDLTSVGTLSVSLAAGGSADVLGDAAGNHAVVDRGASTLVTVDALTPITLTGTVADLTLRLGDGHDSFDIRGSGGPATITLHGDDGSEGGDTDASLRFEGASLQESYAYSSSSGHAGQLVHGGSTIAFTGISDAQLRGNGGDDTLAVQSDSTDSIVTFTAGIAADSGSVQVDSLLPLNFSKVGVGGSVHIAGSSGQDTLRYRGSGADDSYVINETGDVELNGRIMVTTSGVETYDLDGGGGADSLQIAVPIGDVEIDLATGHLTGNLSSSTTPGTIQLAATESLQITGSGRKANRLTISGYGELTAFESVTFNGGFQSDTDDADTVTLQLADVGNDLTVSVTSDQAASISGSNAAPVIDIGGLDATAGRFRIDGGGGTDSLIINGESGADVFQATAGEVSRTVDDQNRMPVAYSGFESVVLSGLAGADTFNVTPSSVPTTVRGGEAAVPQDDVLRVDAGASDVSHSFGESGDAGGIAVVANALISYSGVEGVSVEGDATGTLSLTGTDGPDSFIVTATGTSDFDVVNDSTSVAYTNFATLSLQTLNGNDRVEVTPVITGVDWGVTATLDLGDGVADSVVVNGDGTHQTLEFTPALDSLLIDATAADLSIPGAESLLYRGHGGDDDVIIRATGELRYSVGATNDSGTLDMQSEVPLEFQSLGAGGLIQADFPDAGMPAAPPHRLVIVGTIAADAFEVEPRRVEPGNGIAITHNLTNAETLELIGGLTGDADSVDVSSVQRSLTFAEQTTPNDHNDTDDGLIQLPVEIINGRTSLTAEFRYQAPASLADLVASGQTHLTVLSGQSAARSNRLALVFRPGVEDFALEIGTTGGGATFDTWALPDGLRFDE
ncbi:MAG: beta strand repeat-containing protein, partial [Planctomycetota bacterium]